MSENVLDRVQKLWVASAVTAEADAVSGADRKGVVDALDAAAWQLCKGLPDHPIDAHLSAERARMHAAYQPDAGQWWTDTGRVQEARQARAVVAGLTWVRKGGRPTEAAKIAVYVARELPPHVRDQVELRVYHLCRLAGLAIL